MASVSTPPAATIRSSTYEQSSKIHWTVWCCVAAVTSAIVGGQWDISWHRSIGRDAFLTPAHIAIYLCGVLAGVASSYLILHTTFHKTSPVWESSVTMWGFRGPFGAFLLAWGGVAMLVSAPFDDWWHNAYGLDVKIISPPHALLFLGNGAIQIGAIQLILGAMNRANGQARRRLNWLFLYAGAMMLSLLGLFIMSYSFAVDMHTGTFYRVVATAVPFALIGVGRASHARWGCTKMAAIFTLGWLATVWVLPLFPAEPKLGPVYQRVTTFVPPPFPLLILVPAFFVDLVLDRLANKNAWMQSLAAGGVFVPTFIAVQWPFAYILVGDLAKNRFFGGRFYDYNLHPESSIYRGVFETWETAPQFWTNMALAFATAILLSRLGILWSESMRRVRR